MLDTIIRNWKTSAAGVAIIVCSIAFLLGRITLHDFLGAFSLLAGGGLIAARDGKQQM